MTNSAKARLTPAFDKVIELLCETAPNFGHPGPETATIAPSRAKRPKFEFPDESNMKPAGDAPAAPNSLPSLVEVNGIEPSTSCLQSRRSPN